MRPIIFDEYHISGLIPFGVLSMGKLQVSRPDIRSFFRRQNTLAYYRRNESLIF
jgi:hypothetical protein